MNEREKSIPKPTALKAYRISLRYCWRCLLSTCPSNDDVITAIMVIFYPVYIIPLAIHSITIRPIVLVIKYFKYAKERKPDDE